MGKKGEKRRGDKKKIDPIRIEVKSLTVDFLPGKGSRKKSGQKNGYKKKTLDNHYPLPSLAASLNNIT